MLVSKKKYMILVSKKIYMIVVSKKKKRDFSFYHTHHIITIALSSILKYSYKPAYFEYL